MTKGAELYGTITEEAVHAGQKARGEVYDSEDGIGGRSEGLAEFANKTASSAWELENKIAGISNESNSLQMDNWRTDNSSSETMLIGLGKADNAQDLQPDIYLFGNDNLRIPFPGEDMDLHFGVQSTYAIPSYTLGSDTNWESIKGVDLMPNVGGSIYYKLIYRGTTVSNSVNIGVRNSVTYDTYIGDNGFPVGSGHSFGLSIPLLPSPVNVNSEELLEILKNED